MSFNDPYSSQRGAGSAAAIIIIGIILLLVALYYYMGRGGPLTQGPLQDTASQTTSTSEQPSGSFEFLEVPGFNPAPGIPRTGRSHIIVFSQGVQNARPVRVLMQVDGKQVWEGQIQSGQSNCADQNRCSLDGPEMDPDWEGRRLYLEARDKDGNLLATYQG